MVIDATGTAVICQRAGIPTEVGENYLSYVTHEMNKADADALSETGDFCRARRWRKTGSDIWGNEDNQVPENTVGSFGDFRKKGRRFQLPYTTLYSSKAPNIYAAGRIISAKGEGWEITRVIPVAAHSGQVAGTAAALCLKTNADAVTLDVKLLQETLKAQGVLFK